MFSICNEVRGIMGRFTDRQLYEIGKARERLEACKVKAYYPILPEEPKPQVVEHIHRHSDMSDKDFDLLQQTAAEVKYLRNKVDEIGQPKKTKGIPEPEDLGW